MAAARRYLAHLWKLNTSSRQVKIIVGRRLENSVAFISGYVPYLLQILTASCEGIELVLELLVDVHTVSANAEHALVHVCRGNISIIHMISESV